MSNTDLHTRLAGAFAFEGAPIVTAAADAHKHYESPGEYTLENSKEQMHEFGFYAGAKHERDRLAPLHSALADCVGALSHEDSHWHHPNDEKPVRGCQACEALARLGELLGGEK